MEKNQVMHSNSINDFSTQQRNKSSFPPPPVENPQSEFLFDLNIDELNKKLSKGYLRKKKNAKSPASLVKCELSLRKKESGINFRSLLLSLEYELDQRKRKRRRSPLKWEKLYPIETSPQDTNRGIIRVEFDCDEIYDHIFKELSRNTHIKDEERKIGFRFIVIFTRNENHFKMRLLPESDKFFVCSWRKAVKLEKKKRDLKNQLDREHRLITESKFVGIHPNVGTSSQVVALYVQSSEENIHDLVIQSNRSSIEGFLFIHFGKAKVEVICSVSKETSHPLFKDHLRIICLTPSLNNLLSSSFGGVSLVDVVISIQITKENGTKALQSLSGVCTFKYVLMNETSSTPPPPPPLPLTSSASSSSTTSSTSSSSFSEMFLSSSFSSSSSMRISGHKRKRSVFDFASTHSNPFFTIDELDDLDDVVVGGEEEEEEIDDDDEGVILSETQRGGTDDVEDRFNFLFTDQPLDHSSSSDNNNNNNNSNHSPPPPSSSSSSSFGTLASPPPPTFSEFFPPPLQQNRSFLHPYFPGGVDDPGIETISLEPPTKRRKGNHYELSS